MFFGNATENTIFGVLCDQDRQDNIKTPYLDTTSGREKMFAARRLELQFDYRGKFFIFFSYFYRYLYDLHETSSYETLLVFARSYTFLVLLAFFQKCWLFHTMDTY